jgi:hypothetical protein
MTGEQTGGGRGQEEGQDRRRDRTGGGTGQEEGQDRRRDRT